MRSILLALTALVAPAAALAQTDPNAPQGKLPELATPTAYRLDLTVLPDRPRFTGHAEIDVTLKQAARSIYLHGRNLHVTKATASVGGKRFAVTFTQVTPTGAARLDFGREVQAGPVTLAFDYDAAFGSDPAGLYHIKVGDDWYSWSQFESIDARSAFPSFDEPGYKTPFTVSLTTKKGFVATSNAQELGTSPAGALVKHRFAPTKPLPSYLVAFAVGPFVTAETTVPPTPQRATPLPLRIIATKAQAGKLAYARDESGRIVTLLEKYFDQPFPFPKLDQIGSPVMPGAMENAGADIYGDNILLLDPGATTAQKQQFGMVVAHELSHQWFGDLVTPKWWDDIWLNESFANWMGYRIGNEWRPELNIGANAIGEGFDAMRTDALKAGRPIHERITRDNAIDSAFDDITYGKGGQVVAMIAAYLGDDKFREGVRIHTRRHAYGNASTDDFFASLAEAAKDPRVLASMRSFVDQQGVPVVSIRGTGATLTATQAPYTYYGTAPDARQWVVPVCVRRGDTRTCTLLDGKSGTIAAPGSGPLIPNAGGAGYYRFDLDQAGWDQLVAAAPTLPAGEAMAVTDSLWASFSAGTGPVSELIAMARSMAANPDSNAALDNVERLQALDDRGLVGADVKPALRRIVIGIYQPLYARLGFDPAAGAHAADTPDRQKLRQAVVAGMAGEAEDPQVRAKLRAAADRYLAGDAKALDQAFLPMALRVTVQQQGLPFAKTLTERALASEDPVFRQAALGAVVGADDLAIGRWFLTLNDPRLRGVERLFLTARMISAPNTEALGVDYILDNYDSLAGGNGIFMSSRIPGYFSGLCSTAQADRIEKAIGGKVGATGGKLAFDRALERIRNCAKIKAARTGDVHAALLAVK